jgi:uncharacterized membrane protein YphA (DoxX/SURF4 family)
MATIKQLQTTLRLTYGLVPIVEGLDKITNLLTNWEAYLSPGIRNMLPLEAYTLMKLVGVIEILAGVLTLAKPRIGSWVVMAWLVCIALQLIAGGQYFDVAVRDLVMAIGAYTLAQLSKFTPENTADAMR